MIMFGDVTVSFRDETDVKILYECTFSEIGVGVHWSFADMQRYDMETLDITEEENDTIARECIRTTDCNIGRA